MQEKTIIKYIETHIFIGELTFYYFKLFFAMFIYLNSVVIYNVLNCLIIHFHCSISIFICFLNTKT